MSINSVAAYLGLQLSSPIIVGACPMTLNPETVRQFADAGAGAVVLPSLFEEQVVQELNDRSSAAAVRQIKSEVIDSKQASEFFDGGLQRYLDALAILKRTTSIPIIANLNGCTEGDWLKIAIEIQRAGASAIEVVLESGTATPEMSADVIEERLLTCVRELSELVTIPIAVKLLPFHTNLANLAARLSNAGATGVVCFAHEPAWHVHTDRIEATLRWSLTTSSHINATIAGLIRVRAGAPAISLAACGGISSAEDLVKAVIAGADVVEITSQIYREGPDAIAHILTGLNQYLAGHGFNAFEQLVHSRPKITTHRRAYLKCLKVPHGVDEAVPQSPTVTGDRWGHIN